MKKRRRRAPTAPPSSKRAFNLVPLSCPDCFGVLHFEREGNHGHLLYRCQVDHRYAMASLVHAKESQLERTLWSASLLLLQLSYVYEDLLREMKRAPPAERARMGRRIQEVRKQGLAIRAMIEASHAAD